MTRRACLCLALAGLVAGCASMGKPAEPQQFVVYFETGADTLTPEAQQIVTAAAAAARGRAPGKITVEGHADGGTTRDAVLADRRARAVIIALSGAGVDANEIEKSEGAPAAGLTGVGAHLVIIRLMP